MLSYETLKRNPKDFLTLTGLTRREFDELVVVFALCLPKSRRRRQRRQRAPGAGRHPALSTAADKLLFILVYTKTYSLQTVQAHLFDMSQPTANRYIRQLLPVLADALDKLGMMPERDGSRLARPAVSATETNDLIIDGVERTRQRPKNPEKQRVHYSGKKKTHSDKNIVVVSTRTKKVSYLSQTVPGSVHDKKAAEQAAIHYARDTTLRSDLGFQGYKPNVREHVQPKKNGSTKR